MDEKWVVAAKRADFNRIGQKFGIDPVIARIIRNRDVVDDEDIRLYLEGELGDLASPWLMKDMEKAAAIIIEAIHQKQRVRIVGDYDIDGICSTYLLYQGLGRCGAKADYQIPERIRDGYGINESIIQRAYDDGIDTIITCDNGIAAMDQIRMAKDMGMTVIITDHHEVPFDENGNELPPPADAVVNPKQSACFYPFKGICGGVVAYKLVQALYEAFKVPAGDWEGMLEFAAIATVIHFLLKRENCL